MTQDFAKIRPEPLLEQKSVAAPPAWSLLLTGMVVGIALGVFACVLLYVSGRVPSLPSNQEVAQLDPGPAADTRAGSEETEQAVQFDFYVELPNYEVPVDVEPVPLAPHEIDAGQLAASAVDVGTVQPLLLQTGAFQQRELAESEAARQRILGLPVIVTQQTILGRQLFLVQSGPYDSAAKLTEAEALLRRNNIDSLRVSPR